MEQQNPRPTDGESQAVNQMMDQTQKMYRGFNDYVAFRDDDPTWMLAYKLVLRFLGVVLMIILSPFLLIGLFIAFIAVL